MPDVHIKVKGGRTKLMIAGSSTDANLTSGLKPDQDFSQWAEV
jgi:hypothetical protein